MSPSRRMGREASHVETTPVPPPRTTSAAPSRGHSAQGPGNRAAPSRKKPVATIMATPMAGSQGLIFAGIARAAVT